MKRLPARRWGETKDFEGIAVYLASDESEFVTVQTLVIDGGATARGVGMWDFRPDDPMMHIAGLTRGTTGLGHDLHKVE